MKNSFKILTIQGIPIEIHISWFIIFGLIVFTLAQGYFPYAAPELSRSMHWIIAIISALLLFSSLLLHELSHSIVAKRNKLPIAGITLFVFGGVAHMEKEPPSAKVEFKMAIAGPLMSFALALIFLSITAAGQTLGFPRTVLLVGNYLFIINLAVAIFNLVPGFPLDGGRILRAGLWYFLKDIKTATRIASGFGKAFAFVLMAFGFISLITGNLISGLWFIFIGLFLQEAAETSYRQLLMKKMFSKLYVSDVMSKNVIAVPADAPIDTLVNEYVFKFRHNTFPVIEDDNLIGLVTFHDIKEVPKSEWHSKNAKDILIPLRKNFTIGPRVHITSALAQLAANRIGRLLVTENHKIVGILSQKDIIRLFEIKTNLEEE